MEACCRVEEYGFYPSELVHDNLLTLSRASLCPCCICMSGVEEARVSTER